MKAREYQNKVFKILQNIFGANLVRQEWDSVEYDGHSTNHKVVYAPRHDIAVGPFNSYLTDLDIGVDRTKTMQSHPFTVKLFDGCLKNRGSLNKVWNNICRCYLAIELEFSGSSKHILGSVVNASVSGAIGIIVTTKNKVEKINKLVAYLMRLEGLERIQINQLNNLVIFGEDEFLKFLLDITEQMDPK